MRGAFVGPGVVVSLVLVTACAPAPPRPGAVRVIDLGHALDEADPTWSGTPVFTHATVATIAKDTYFAAKFSAEEHFGTHVDAPAHFAEQGLTVDRIPADRLVRPGIAVDVVANVRTDEDYRVTREDLEAFERGHGRIPEGSIVLIATGWDSRWPSAAQYMNVRGGKKHFPGLSVEAAAFLARERRVAAIGIDTPSVDYGLSEQFEAHRTSMPQDVYHVENATGLTSLPPKGFTVVVAPIKIKGGSGGPTRVFALVN